MKRLTIHFAAVLIALSFLFLGFNAGTKAQTFLNDNFTCEDIPVVGTSDGTLLPANLAQSVGCGSFNDDGLADFPDCVVSVDSLNSLNNTSAPTYSILSNTTQNDSALACVNLGGQPQFTTEIINNDSNNMVTASATDPVRLGSLVVGPFGGAFDSFAHPIVENPDDDVTSVRSLAFLLSQAGGGFGSGIVTGDEVALESAMPIPLIPMPLLFPVDASFSQHRSSVLTDCNGDGALELVLGVHRGEVMNITPGALVMQNNGSGFSPADNTTDFFEFLPAGDAVAVGVTLTAADFDGDGDEDIVAGVRVLGGLNVEEGAYLALGENDGSCNYNFPNILADSQLVDRRVLCPAGVADPNCFTGPVSSNTGDFNGDGLLDVVVVEQLSQAGVPFPNLAGNTLYLFNNGGDFSTWPTQGFPLIFNNAQLFDVAVGQFSTVAVQNNMDEAVVSASATNEAGDFLPPGLIYRPTDGNGGFEEIELLAFTPTAASLSAGLEARDFDGCGGDDLVGINVLSDQNDPISSPATSNLGLFLNENEAPILTVNAPEELLANQINEFSATCSDPTLDDRIFTISVVDAPSGANVQITPSSGTLENPTEDFTFSVEIDTRGAYTLRVDCQDSCGVVASQELVYSIPLTQGSCIANLNPQSKTKGVAMTGSFILFLIPVLLMFRRLGRRVLLSLALMLTFGLAALSPAKALDTSFSVNTFFPTIDDSAFFTVYDSPTMLQRNYHVGFYLDYAHQPYEFGDEDFDRIGGIVDHLLTGNIVGSYGIYDWFTAGLRIPIYFYQGINSPILGLDESNFALGDIDLVLKFRLLDREKHHVGIAILPFISFPSSTNSGDFLGNGSFAGGAKLVIDGKIGERVALALNLGYNSRDRIFDVGNNDLDDQFLLSLGLSVEVYKKIVERKANKINIILEGETATVTRDFFSDRRTTPSEARLGFRYTRANNHDINVGAGLGVSNGIGNPQYRIFAGYTYTKRPLVEETLPPPPISEIQIGDELTLRDKIYFEFDKSNIREISKPTLDKIAAFLKAHPEVTKIRVDGYTCDLGSNRYNLGLSQRRANSVARYLEAQGIDPNRVGSVTGHGETNFLVPNVDEPSREQNRRVQIFVEAVDYSLRQ